VYRISNKPDRPNLTENSPVAKNDIVLARFLSIRSIGQLNSGRKTGEIIVLANNMVGVLQCVPWSVKRKPIGAIIARWTNEEASWARYPDASTFVRTWAIDVVGPAGRGI
jgi:hypothetical protein